MGPIIHGVRVGEELIECVFVESCLFVLSKKQCPSFIGEPGIANGLLVLDQLVAISFGSVIYDNIVLAGRGKLGEVHVVVPMSWDP